MYGKLLVVALYTYIQCVYQRQREAEPIVHRGKENREMGKACA